MGGVMNGGGWEIYYVMGGESCLLEDELYY